MFFLPYELRWFICSITFFNCNVYAGYHSYKAISKQETQETTRWLLYWTIIGVVLFLENIVSFFLHNVMPLYPEVKFGLLLMLVISPSAAGNVLNGFIIPFVRANGLDRKVLDVCGYVVRIIVQFVGDVYYHLVMKAIEYSVLSPTFLHELRVNLDQFSMRIAKHIPASQKRKATRFSM